jgi:hypothetical protein
MKKMAKAGVRKERKYAFAAKLLKKPSEAWVSVGPFLVNDKKYVSIAYFKKWDYRKAILKNGIYMFMSLIFPPSYYRAKSISSKAHAMLTLDYDGKVILDMDINIKASRTALVWIDIFVLPVFRKGSFRYVNSMLKTNEKLYLVSIDRKIPEPKNDTERLFFKNLSIMDEQIIEHYHLFKNYSTLLMVAEQLFKEVRDKPSDTNVLKLKEIVKRLSSSAQALSEWSERSSKFWFPFLESKEFYKSHRDSTKGHGTKVLGRILYNGFLSLIAYFAVGNNLTFTMIFATISELGLEGYKQIKSLRWAASLLRRQEKSYKQFSFRLEKFLELYDKPIFRDFLR